MDERKVTDFPDIRSDINRTEGTITHGENSISFSTGSKYIGNLKNGRPNGYGTFIFPNGTRYEGEWEDGFLTGKVNCHFANGDAYVGHIKDRKPHGRGTFTWASGGSYTGEWECGLYHGKGVLTFPQGSKLTGVFKNGKFCKKC